MRNHRAVLVVAALIALGAAGLGHAEPVTTVDVVSDRPAATLLLPNFVVDFDAEGKSTVMSINNASATAVLAHVTVWSDLAVPVLQFNVYLTGYDVQVISLRNVLNGALPQTASAGQDPQDTISPHGPFSQDINFASCNGILPAAQLSAPQVAHVKAALMGLPSSFVSANQCYGINRGDNKARGFVTVDTVNNCTARFPGDAGYFAAGGTGDATNQNVLYGDYAFKGGVEAPSRGTALVHIVADGTKALLSTADNYTFYGRLVGWTAVDNRQPLATNFFTRYLSGGGTTLTVWRDPKVAQQSFTCGSLPTWYPLSQDQIVLFDEQEHATVPVGLTPFGAATQRVRVGGGPLPTPYASGTVFLNLNHGFSSPSGNPVSDPAAAQAWVDVSSTVSGQFASGYRAIQLDSATAAHHQVIQ